MSWEQQLQQRLATDREYANAHRCDDTKAEARLSYIGDLLEQYEEMSDKAEGYSWNEGYVNVRVWVLDDLLGLIAEADDFWEAP